MEHEPPKLRLRVAPHVPGRFTICYNELPTVNVLCPPHEIPPLVQKAADVIGDARPLDSELFLSLGTPDRVQSVACGRCKALLPPARPLEIMARQKFLRWCDECAAKEAPNLLGAMKIVLQLPDDPQPQPPPPALAPKPDEPTAAEIRERMLDRLTGSLLAVVECHQVQRPERARDLARLLLAIVER